MEGDIGIADVISNRGLNGFYGGDGYGRGGRGYGNFQHDGSVINAKVEEGNDFHHFAAGNASRERDFMAANSSRERDNISAEIRLSGTDQRLDGKLDRIQDSLSAQHNAIQAQIANGRVESVRDTLQAQLDMADRLASMAAAAAECCCENRVANATNGGAIAALQVSVSDLARDRSQDEILRAINDLPNRGGH